MFRLAQTLKVHRCSDACIAALTALAPEQLSHADVCALLSRLYGTGPAQQEQVQQLCLRRLLLLYGDVNMLLNMPSMLKLWQGLTLKAVLLWAGSDQVQVIASENDVVVALDRWVGAEPEGSLSPGQLDQLSACVRVKQVMQIMLGALANTRPAADDELMQQLGVPAAWADLAESVPRPGKQWTFSGPQMVVEGHTFVLVVHIVWKEGGLRMGQCLGRGASPEDSAVQWLPNPVSVGCFFDFMVQPAQAMGAAAAAAGAEAAGAAGQAHGGRQAAAAAAGAGGAGDAARAPAARVVTWREIEMTKGLHLMRL